MAVATFEPGRHGVRFKKQEIQPQTKFINTNTCVGLQYTTSVQTATAVLQKTDVSWRYLARCIIRVLYYCGMQQNEQCGCGRKIQRRAMLFCQHLRGWTEEKKGISQKRDLRRNTYAFRILRNTQQKLYEYHIGYCRQSDMHDVLEIR